MTPDYMFYDNFNVGTYRGTSPREFYASNNNPLNCLHEEADG